MSGCRDQGWGSAAKDERAIPGALARALPPPRLGSWSCAAAEPLNSHVCRGAAMPNHPPLPVGIEFRPAPPHVSRRSRGLSAAQIWTKIRFPFPQNPSPLPPAPTRIPNTAEGREGQMASTGCWELAALIHWRSTVHR